MISNLFIRCLIIVIIVHETIAPETTEKTTEQSSAESKEDDETSTSASSESSESSASSASSESSSSSESSTSSGSSASTTAESESSDTSEKGKNSTAKARPVWIFGHMANTISDVDDYLSMGVNAIESDVDFYPNGTARRMYHGFPCDLPRWCWGSEDIVTYLTYMRTLSLEGHHNYNENLTLLMLDLKIEGFRKDAEEAAGEDIASKLLRTIFRKEEGNDNFQPLNVILSLPKTGDRPFVEGFMRVFNGPEGKEFKKYIGWDISSKEQLEKISELWESLDVGTNIWQGDGITNVLSWYPDNSRLFDALKDRNSGGKTAKVYSWTIDSKKMIRDVLRYGVDGIMANYIENVFQVLHEPVIKRYVRLATRKDTPWERLANESFFEALEKEVNKSEASKQPDKAGKSKESDKDSQEEGEEEKDEDEDEKGGGKVKKFDHEGKDKEKDKNEDGDGGEEKEKEEEGEEEEKEKKNEDEDKAEGDEKEKDEDKDEEGGKEKEGEEGEEKEKDGDEEEGEKKKKAEDKDEDAEGKDEEDKKEGAEEEEGGGDGDGDGKDPVSRLFRFFSK